MAAPVKPAEAAGPANEAIDPFFVETKARINDHLTRWFDLNAECKMRDRALKNWEKHNPRPTHKYFGDEGFDPMASSDWLHRQQNLMRSLRLAHFKGERNDSGAAFNQAVKTFAAMDADNLAELIFKVETGIMMDSSDGKIARSVLFDIVRLRRDGDLEYSAA